MRGTKGPSRLGARPSIRPQTADGVGAAALGRAARHARHQDAREGIALQVAQKLIRHSDYRLTLKHYTTLTLSDSAAAMKRLPGIAKPEVAQATGTLGAGADDPQQILQQSAHEPVRDGATSCDARASGEPSPNGRNGLESATLRDETRAAASSCAGAPARTRTWDRRIRNPRAGSTSDGGPVTCEGTSTSPSSFPSTRPRETDPDLLALAEAWPHLPEPLRAGIVAMVRAAQQKEKT